MLAYDVVERVDQTLVALASFTAPWAASVPIFHDLARAYFALRGPGPARELLFYATLEEEGEPDRIALVCSARLVLGQGDDEVEIRAGPLLEIALRARRH
jgi:hypothetical protein